MSHRDIDTVSEILEYVPNATRPTNKTSAKIYVATIVRGDQKIDFSGVEGGGCKGTTRSFTGFERDDVVQRALAHAKTWNENSVGTERSYVVLVGELTHKAKPNIAYDLERL